ncbi:MAG: hypothetical protein IKX48_16195 [Victivallales bacterium]|nr:hypothetical protein [Victivallales bacterium]
MRTPPDHITKEIHKRDPKADIIWDDRLHVWKLYWDGQPICALSHDDGTDMLEPCLDEILDFMASCDNWRNGQDRIRHMRQAAESRKRRIAARLAAGKEEAAAEARKVGRVLKNGVSPQVYIHNNPLA